MIFKRTAIIAAGFAMAISAPLSAQEAEAPAPTAETVVATVNGAPITVGHVIALADRLPAEYKTLEANVLYTGIIEQLIQQELLAARVDDQAGSIKYAVENERRALLATEAIDRIGDAAVTEAAVQRIYAERYVDVEPAQDFLASHILVKTEEEANEVIDTLNEGADFAETAREKSTGPSGVNGGELGWIEPGQTVAPFEAAALALQPGELSAPVETQFGWHVIKMAELRDHQPPALEDVREAIAAELGDAAIEEAIRILDDGAVVERLDEALDPSFVTDSSLLD